MMKNLALIAGILFSTSSFAQVRDLMNKKIGEKIKPKTEATPNTTNTNTTTIDTTAQKNANPNNQYQGGSNPWAAKMGGKADAQAEYSFSSNVYVELQNYKKDGTTKDEASMVRYHFSDKEYYGTEMQIKDKKGKTTESFGVSEFNKGQIVSLINSDGEKTGSVMKIDLQKKVDEGKDTSGVTVTKTGKTKTILTYNCEQYIITDKEGNTTDSWMTTALPFDIKKMMASNRGNQGYGTYGDGFMMEMTMTQKDGSKTTWKVTEVNLNTAKKIVTGYYTFPF